MQKDGVRKTFTSAKPGRTGQREANKKADDWLENGLQTRGKTVESAYKEYLARESKISGISNFRPKESRWRIWIQPEIGHRRLESLTQQQVQTVLDNAKASHDRCVADAMALTVQSPTRFCSGFRLICLYAICTALFFLIVQKNTAQRRPVKCQHCAVFGTK